MKGLMITLLLAQSTGAGHFSSSELALGVVRILDAEAVVIKSHGQPERTEPTGSDFAPLKALYPKLEFLLGGGRVRGIRSADPEVCTPARVCPGSRIGDVLRLYGPPSSERTSELNYVKGSDWCWLRLTVSHGVVDSVAVLCEP